MAFKKPSDFFNKDSNDKGNQKIPENFGVYKNNLNKVNTLNEFAENFGSFSENIQKIGLLEESILDLKEELKSALKQEDLDNAMMSNLLVLEENILNIQKNIEGINKKNLKKVYEEVENIVKEVENVTEQLPVYNRLIKSSEVSFDEKLSGYQQTIDEKLKNFDATIDSKFTTIEENLEGINENSINQISSQVSDLGSDVKKFKNHVVEASIEIDSKILSFEEKVSSDLENHQNLIREEITRVNESVQSLITEEIPKYQHLLTGVKIENDKKVEEIVSKFAYKIKSLTENAQRLNDEVENKSKILDRSFTSEIKKLEEHILSVKRDAEETSSTYKKLYNVIEAKGLRDTSQFKDLELVVSNISNNLNEAYSRIEETKEYFGGVENEFVGRINALESDLETQTKKIRYINESLSDDVSSLKKQVKSFPSIIEEKYNSISRKLNFIEESINKVNEKTILKEEGSLLTGTEKERTQDPLTPLDKNFVTFNDLSNHYRQFINRIQIQLASIGGGGAGFIKDLDDVTFDQTTGENKLLIYNGSQWVGIASTALGAGGVGAGGTWTTDSVGISTTKSVGISTTSAKAGVSLYVVGDIEATGNVNVAGTVTYNDVTNVDSLGIVTARGGVHVGIDTGFFTEDLVVNGSARITGILTVGRSSVTIDGDNNIITSGIVTITNSQIYLGDNITISGSASGINSAPNVLYVAKDGNDENNGTSIDNAKLTISGAVAISTTGTVIKVLAGNYAENNPIEVPAFVSIVGDDLKTVTVTPNTATKDILHVRKGCYVANMTFTNHVAPAAAIGFPTSEIATNVGGGKWESPYIQNCTSNTTTGTGLRIDGAQAESLKSIVCDSYTQYNQGGVGVAITNEGFGQLVSIFTICCNEAITCHKGSTCDLTNSNSSFGTYGLVADGISDLQTSGIVTTSAAAAQDNVVINIGAGTTRPYDGQVVYFDQLYQSVETINVGSGGTGYSSTPTVTIDSPTGPNGETATAFATLDGDSVSEITIISSGSQYIGTPNITISGPQSGVNTATATISMAPIYYTINSSTPVVSGITTLTLDENLINTVGVGSTAYFFQQSKIVASSHTFEYVGSGNTITLATPKRGGVTIHENEVVTTNGGKVVYTSTDQAGNFRMGDGLQINQNTGTISGRAFTRSLFSEMTPFILALS